MNVLQKIQFTLKAPKAQFNSFGKYKYRSCEDILEALKPLLMEHNATLTLSDTIEAHGNRVYIKATATLKAGDFTESVTAYARESESKKGMDESQITGTASSYARKYALNGLFLIDDTKDADTMDNSHEGKSDPFVTDKKYYLNNPNLNQKEKDKLLGMELTPELKETLDNIITSRSQV